MTKQNIDPSSRVGRARQILIFVRPSHVERLRSKELDVPTKSRHPIIEWYLDKRLGWFASLPLYLESSTCYSDRHIILHEHVGKCNNRRYSALRTLLYRDQHLDRPVAQPSLRLSRSEPRIPCSLILPVFSPSALLFQITLIPHRSCHLASNCTILPKVSQPTPQQPLLLLQTSFTYLFVLSLYSTLCPQSLHRIGSPFFSWTFELHEPQRYCVVGPASSALPVP